MIIPTYNRADCITKALDSVLAQSYKDYEIIVVNDGSTDKTDSVLRDYHDRIRYIHQENKGCASARNKGIQAARGEWIAFLDSDDKWVDCYLQWQMQCIKHFRTKVSVANILPVYKSDTTVALTIDRPLDIETDSKLFNDPLEITLVDNPHAVTLPGMVIERKLIHSLGGFDETLRWASDRRFILRLAAQVPFAYINRSLVIVDRVPGQIRLTEGRDAEAKKIINISHILNYSEVYLRCRSHDKRITRKARRELGRYLSNLAAIYCDERDMYKARRFALDGLHFGGDWRTYRRCFAVLLCPWLIRHFGRR